jgi:hypothetical protein
LLQCHFLALNRALPAFFCQQLSHLNPPNYAIHKFPM